MNLTLSESHCFQLVHHAKLRTEALIAQGNVEMQLFEKGMMKIIFTCKIYINSESQIMG